MQVLAETMPSVKQNRMVRLGRTGIPAILSPAPPARHGRENYSAVNRVHSRRSPPAARTYPWANFFCPFSTFLSERPSPAGDVDLSRGLFQISGIENFQRRTKKTLASLF